MSQHHSFKGLLIGTGFRSLMSQLSSLLFLVILLVASVATAKDPVGGGAQKPKTSGPGAGDTQESNASNPGEGANQGSYTGNIGDNINLFDGSLSLSQVDVFLPGRAGLDLMLTRRYNSSIFFRNDVGSTDYDDGSWGTAKRHGELGDGWDMTIGRCDTVANIVYYGDGTSEEYFANTGTGSSMYPWRTISGNRLNGAENTLWLLNGTKYIYGKTCNLTGADSIFRGNYLTQIIDVFGNRDSVVYMDAPFPFIESIYDALNRVVEFQYTDTSRWSKLSKIRYYNYKDSNPNWLEVNYSYNATHQLRKVTNPNGDSVVYDYTNSILKPNGSSGTFAAGDSTRILKSVRTTRGGEVLYAYILSKEEREFRDSTIHHYWADTLITGYNPPDTQITQHEDTSSCPAYRYVNHWSIYKRYARSDSTGTYDSTTIQYVGGNCSDAGWGNGTDAIRHHTTLTDPLGLITEYCFSINTDVRDWGKVGNSSYYYKGIGLTDVVPGALQAIESASGPLFECTQSYYRIAFGTDQSAPYLVRPGCILETRPGSYSTCTIWAPFQLCGVISKPVPFDTVASTPLWKKVGEPSYLNTNYTIDSISGSSYDSTSNIYRVTRRTLINHKGSDVDSTVVSYNYNTGLKTLQSMTTTRGNKSVTESFVYDTDGNVTYSYDANNFYTQYVYDNAKNAFIIETKRQVNGDTVMTVSKADYYWQAGIPAWTEGANGDRTYYGYDNFNRLTSVKLPLETDSSSYRRYIPASNTVLDSAKTIGGGSPKWRVTLTKYDGFNNVVSSRLKMDGGYYRDSTMYDTEGRVKKAFLTHPDTEGSPHFTEYKYDTLGRVVKTISPMGDADSVNYIDERTTEMIAATGRRVKTVKDFFGNVDTTYSNYVGTTYNDVSTSTYLPFGKRSSTKPPKGSAYRDTLTYDAFGNVRTRRNPDEGWKRYYYNKLGQLRLAHDSVGTWTYFKYDGMGRITEQGVVSSVSNPDTVWTNNSYPTAGLSQKINKRYDSYRDSVSTAYLGSALAAPQGLLTEVSDPTGHNYFFYDLRGRVLEKVTRVYGDSVRIHRYTYHPGDMVDSMYYPQCPGATADSIKYGYYDYGWTRSVSGYTSSTGLTYEPYGAVAAMSLTPSVSITAIDVEFEHDEAGRLTKQYVTNTVPYYDDAVFRRSYRFSGGDIIRVNETNSSGDSLSIAQAYAYDGVGRLDTAADYSLSSTRNYHYWYDKNGNFDSISVSAAKSRYEYQSNKNRLRRLVHSGPNHGYAYNANGCLTYDSMGVFAIAYDYRNMDTLVTQVVYGEDLSNSADTLRLFYDYTGRRVKKTSITHRQYNPCTFKSSAIQDGSQVGKSDGSETAKSLGRVPDNPCAPRWNRVETSTYYYYSGSEVSLVVGGYAGDWSISIYAAGKKIATRASTSGGSLKKTFEVSDYLGNLRSVFHYDNQNTLRLGEAFWYNPFGKQDSVIIAGTDRHRFTYNGKEFDEGTELSRYYYGARYYDPELGRFMTPDPIKDDWTPYSYVRNNPIAYSDPTGMSYSGGGGNPELVGSDNPDPDSWGRPDPFDPIAEAIANSMPGDMVTVYNRYGHAIYVHQERTKTSTGENSTKNDKKLDFNLPDTVPDEEVEFDFGLEGSGGDTEEASLGDRVAEILWDDPKFIFAGGVMVYTGVIMTVASGYGIVICAGSGPESWAGIPFLFISGSAGVGVTAEGVTFLTNGFNWRYHTHIPSLSEVDPTHFPNPFKDMK